MVDVWGGSWGAAWDSHWAESQADVTAPVLSNPSGIKTGQTTAALAVDTDEGNGTLYWVVTTSSTPPSGAQVAAGQDHTGAAAVDSGSQAVNATGTQNVAGGASGLTAATEYWAHFVQDDAALNQSDVASSASFTTDAEPEDVDIGIGAGSYWKKRLAEEDESRDRRWQQRRKQLEKISRLVDGISDEVPSDVPEAQVIKQAEERIEEAANKLSDPPQFTDYKALAAAVRRAEAALRQAEAAYQRYEARKRRELDEQDDEDVLLLLA
jgi:hypothetical protein